MHNNDDDNEGGNDDYMTEWPWRLFTYIHSLTAVPQSCSDHRQVVYTHVRRFNKQHKLVPANVGDTLKLRM